MSKSLKRNRQPQANFKHYQTFVEEEQQQNTLETFGVGFPLNSVRFPSAAASAVVTV
jgi:hypothetical protein